MPASKHLSRKTRNDPNGFFKINNELKPLIAMARTQGAEPSLAQVIESNRFININKQTGASADMTLFRDFALCPSLNPIGSPRISFSRASGATQINQAGFIEYAPENLFLYSQDISESIWDGDGQSKSSGLEGAPDGSSTVGRFYSTISGNWYPRQPVNLINTIYYTVSAYIKKGGATPNQLNFAYFNGTFWTEGPSLLSSLGGDFFRVSYTFQATSANSNLVGFHLIAGANSGVQVWGLQLERGSSARAYNKTEGSVYYGPRFDYDPTTHAGKGLLIEESRTNFVIDSSGLSSFDTNSVFLSSDSVFAPDNSSANFLTEDSNNLFHQIFKLFSVTTSANYSYSIFVKASSRKYLTMHVSSPDGVGVSAFTVDTNAGVVTKSMVRAGTSDSILVDAFPNGWFRISLNFLAGQSSIYIISTLSDIATPTYGSFGNYEYQGNGISGLYIWGAQLEAGSFPTSYIPTTSSTVTRAADLPSIIGNDFSAFYNSSQGTLLIDHEWPVGVLLSVSGLKALFAIAHGTTDGANLYSVDGGNGLEYPATSNFAKITSAGRANWVIAYGDSGRSSCLNGGSIFTDGNNFANMDLQTSLLIGSERSSSFQAAKWIRKIIFFNKKQSSATLQSLTG